MKIGVNYNRIKFDFIKKKLESAQRQSETDEVTKEKEISAEAEDRVSVEAEDRVSAEEEVSVGSWCLKPEAEQPQ